MKEKKPERAQLH